jgi:hypothetical protein
VAKTPAGESLGSRWDHPFTQEFIGDFSPLSGQKMDAGSLSSAKSPRQRHGDHLLAMMAL